MSGTKEADEGCLLILQGLFFYFMICISWQPWKVVSWTLVVVEIEKKIIDPPRLSKIQKLKMSRSCPESNRGYSDILKRSSEPNVITTTLHNQLYESSLHNFKINQYSLVLTLSTSVNANFCTQRPFHINACNASWNLR